MVKSEGIPQKKWCPTTKKEKKRERERERERERKNYSKKGVLSQQKEQLSASFSKIKFTFPKC